MNRDFMIREIEDVIKDFERPMQIKIKLDMKFLNNPKTIGDFVDELIKSVQKNDSNIMRCFKLIETLKIEDFFDVILEIIPKLNNTVQMEYALKSISAIPNDKDVIFKGVLKILDLMKNCDNEKIIYQGVCLLYRINEAVNIENVLKENTFSISDEVIKNLLIILDNMMKYESQFHKKLNSENKTYLDNKSEFINFANLFIKF